MTSSIQSRKGASGIATTTDTEHAAQVGVSGIGMSAVAMLRFANIVGEQRPEDLVTELRKRVNAVNNGDLEGVEAMLLGQAVALQAIFANFVNRSAMNVGEHLQATETYMKLALRAQSQCRATLETLANIKHPRAIAFVGQANISHGHQQVNNAPAHTEETKNQQTQLLEDQHGERMDTRTERTPGRVDSGMETVGAINRTKD